MAVFERSSSPHDRPNGAIAIRREQVASFYQVVVDTWKPQSEIWALTWGPKILGVAGAFSGWYGNVYFRKKLKLKNYGFFSMYLPNVALPFLIVNSFHSSIILKDVYLDPYGCTLCKGTKAATLQVALGLVQPLLLVPASAFMFATRHFTHRIPSAIHNRKEFLRFVGKLYSPLKIPMGVNVIVQTLLAFFITHMEENHFLYLQKAMVKQDAEEDESELGVQV